MKFLKMQAAGNDFVLVDSGQMRRDWAKLSRAICNRHLGIGADGLLLVLPSQKADYRMRIFNSDGSEAESCGNGLRCFVKYIKEFGLVEVGRKEIKIETLAGIRSARASFRKGRVVWVKVSMGKPELNAEKVPVRLDKKRWGNIVDIMSVFNYPLVVDEKELGLTFVSMGNPHAVCLQEETVANFPLGKIGPEVEHHQLFPKRTNFELVNVLNRHQVKARVWERGVGETLACGTGACAIGVAAMLQKLVDNPVDIILPGGTLRVEWDGQGEVWLSGPVEMVFTGEWLEKR
jgi:diaminopimelate epimerase